MWQKREKVFWKKILPEGWRFFSKNRRPTQRSGVQTFVRALAHIIFVKGGV